MWQMLKVLYIVPKVTSSDLIFFWGLSTVKILTPSANNAINLSSDLLKYLIYLTGLTWPSGVPYKDFPDSTSQIIIVFLSSTPPILARYYSLNENVRDYINTLCILSLCNNYLDSKSHIIISA